MHICAHAEPSAHTFTVSLGNMFILADSAAHDLHPEPTGRAIKQADASFNTEAGVCGGERRPPADYKGNALCLNIDRREFKKDNFFIKAHHSKFI